MQLDVVHNNHATEVGSYFVANYPPFSVWSAEHIPDALRTLDTPPALKWSLERANMSPRSRERI